MRILLDVTRTISRIRTSTPTGIDRVEHALVRWLLADGITAWPNAGFVVTTPAGHGVLDRAAMAAVMQGIDDRQRQPEGTQNRLLPRIAEWLADRPAPVTAQSGVLRLNGGYSKDDDGIAYVDLARAVVAGARDFQRVLRTASSKETVYLHASHALLEQPRLFNWLPRRGIRALFVLHDLIPIDTPEFSSDPSGRVHETRITTMARFADLVIANSAFTRDRFEAFAAERGLAKPRTTVSLLANELRSRLRPASMAPASSTPYFICIGTIEGRKNIAFLLNVWRSIAARRPPDAVPRLIIVGKRGWRCRDVFETLERTREVGPYIAEVNGLRDSELQSLMSGATALLTPSLTEGYSLPPVEAVLRGLPVIASDIPVHRELLGNRAELLDPTDGIGWRSAVLRLAEDAEHRAARAAATGGLPRRSWNDYARDVFALAADRPRLPQEDRSEPPVLAGPDDRVPASPLPVGPSTAGSGLRTRAAANGV